MSSSFADYFNAKARPMLAAIHSELVTFNYTDGQGYAQSDQLKGTWRRVMPDAATDPDGLGAQGYTGEATFVVNLEDLAALPGPEAEIIRLGETWTIKHGERQDEWTWILHLSRPDADVRMPGRFK